MMPEFEVTWTGADDVLKAKAQQLPPPVVIPFDSYARPAVLGWLKGQRAAKRFTQQQIQHGVHRHSASVHTALKQLVVEGLVEQIDTHGCTRDGARLLYVLVKGADA